jgi:hypothetical protein
LPQTLRGKWFPPDPLGIFQKLAAAASPPPSQFVFQRKRIDMNIFATVPDFFVAFSIFFLENFPIMGARKEKLWKSIFWT